MPESAHRSGSISTDLGRKNLTEAVPPEPDGFLRDIDTPCVENILDVPPRERISDIHHHGQTDDFRRGFEVSEDG